MAGFRSQTKGALWGAFFVGDARDAWIFAKCLKVATIDAKERTKAAKSRHIARQAAR